MVLSVKTNVTGAVLCLMMANPALGFVRPNISDVVVTAQPGEPQENIPKDTGAANRIVAGGLLRTLSQEIPAAVCHLHNGIDVDEAAALLTDSINKFDTMTLALLNGNAALGIHGGETRRKTIVELENLIADWQPIQDAALAVLARPDDADAAAIVYGSADVMFEKTYHLLSKLEGQYAIPTEVLQSDIMLLEVSGRMAAMTQRMAYETCRVWSGDGTDVVVSDLEATTQILENSMYALRDGLPELGILSAPTAEIAAGLGAVAADWDMIGGYIDQVIAGDVVSVASREDLYHQLAIKLHKVEEIEILYQDYSKRVIH